MLSLKNMKQAGFISTGLLIIAAVGSLVGAGYFAQKAINNYKDNLATSLLGGTILSVTAEPTRLAGSGVSATATSIDLVKFRTPGNAKLTMTDFGGTGYATIEPGRSKKEFISFTGITQNADGTAQLTGVTRGLNFVSPYTASTTLRKAHSGGSVLVVSNPPQLYDSLVSKVNASTLSAVLTITSSTIATYDANPTFSSDNEIITKKYADDLAIAGVPDANTTTKGIFEAATKAETAAGTASGSTTALLAVPNSSFSATQSATTTVPVTGVLGKLAQGFLDLTEAFTFSGGLTSSATTTLSATTTISGDLTVSGNATSSGSFDFSTNLPTVPTADATASDQVISKSHFDGNKGEKLHIATTTASVGNSTTETALLSATIGASEIGSDDGLRLKSYISDLDFSSLSESLNIDLQYGATTICTVALADIGTSTNRKGFIEALIVNNASTTSQTGVLEFFAQADHNALSTAEDETTHYFCTGTANEDSATALTARITAQWSDARTGTNISSVLGVIEELTD